jgi:hypothetical protein
MCPTNRRASRFGGAARRQINDSYVLSQNELAKGGRRTGRLHMALAARMNLHQRIAALTKAYDVG